MKTKSTKHMSRFLAALVTLCMLCMMMITPVMAEEGLAAGADPRNGVMQIALGYQGDDGVFHDYQWGTCFLINEEYVLTNKHVVTMTKDDFADFKAYFNKPDMKANDNHIKLYLYVNRDMKVAATMHSSVNSDDMDFAAVKLAEKIYDRQPIALGDSDTVQPKDTVYALGFPADSIQNKEYNTSDDVSMVSGTVSKISSSGNVDIIEHGADLNNGNSGGPLLDENNNVVGINTFGIDKKSYSIQINAVKKGLDTFGITYVHGGEAAAEPVVEDNTATEEPAEEEPLVPDNSAALANLQTVLNEAKAINADDYTKDSIAALDDCIAKAETVANKGADATEAEINVAKDDLNNALVNLEKPSGPNMILIGGIIAAVIVLILIIAIVVSSSKKKSKSAPVPGPAPGPGPMPKPQPPINNVPPMDSSEGAGETTLLDAGSGETTLLGGGGSSAYLIRTKNGERIAINQQNFKLGKERRRVNYCVADNTTVSRLHCEIVKRGSDYFVVDLGSANYTYVNGIQITPNKETLLTDRSILKLSDEEFEFHA